MKRWLKRSLIGLALLTAGGWLSLALLLDHWTARPPPLPADTSITRLKPETRDGKTWLGQSWLEQREGLPVLRLKGSPFELGYASGVLLREKSHTLENEFLAMIRGYVPQQWKIDLLKNYVIYRNRNLSDFVPLDYRLQFLGSTMGCPDVHPELGDYYNRVINYHAAQDISYLMIDNPLVTRAGCTAFGAWGAATEGGHLISGRNFDWEAAEVFSRDRVVILCEPDGGIPFASLAWAGMAGVVSGMNRAGLSVTINGAPSGLPEESATPVAIVARDVLQKAPDLASALEIIRRAKVFVSTLWLVGSRADGKFVVVEKTPAVTNVREPVGDAIICANHFQTDGLRSEPRNTNYLAEATSLSRLTRLTELLALNRAILNPARAADILRDRRLPGGIFAGNDHRGTLNAFIATHATVMDLTEGIFWAASPPNQSGRFVAFDLSDFSRRIPDRTLAADPVLASGERDRALASLKRLASAERALHDNKASEALAEADRAEALNPGFYRTDGLRARALLALGRTNEAGRAAAAALAGQPAFASEKIKLEAIVKQTRAP